MQHHRATVLRPNHPHCRLGDTAADSWGIWGEALGSELCVLLRTVRSSMVLSRLISSSVHLTGDRAWVI